MLSRERYIRSVSRIRPPSWVSHWHRFKICKPENVRLYKYPLWCSASVAHVYSGLFSCVLLRMLLHAKPGSWILFEWPTFLLGLCADIVYCKQISASLFSSSVPGFTALRNGIEDFPGVGWEIFKASEGGGILTGWGYVSKLPVRPEFRGQREQTGPRWDE